MEDIGAAPAARAERCLAFGHKPELFGALHRARRVLVAGKHLQAALRRAPLIDRFKGEHPEVVRVVQVGEGERAAALVAHLEASRDKAADRLRRFHEGHAITSRHLTAGEPLTPALLRAQRPLRGQLSAFPPLRVRSMYCRVTVSISPSTPCAPRFSSSMASLKPATWSAWPAASANTISER